MYLRFNILPIIFNSYLMIQVNNISTKEDCLKHDSVKKLPLFTNKMTPHDVLKKFIYNDKWISHICTLHIWWSSSENVL